MNLGSHFRPEFKVGQGTDEVAAQSLHAIRQPNLSNCGLFILSLYLGRCASGQVQIFQLYVSGEIAKLVLLKGVFVCFSLAWRRCLPSLFFFSLFASCLVFSLRFTVFVVLYGFNFSTLPFYICLPTLRERRFSFGKCMRYR